MDSARRRMPRTGWPSLRVSRRRGCEPSGSRLDRLNCSQMSHVSSVKTAAPPEAGPANIASSEAGQSRRVNPRRTRRLASLDMLQLKWMRPDRHQIKVRFLYVLLAAVLVSSPTSATDASCPAREFPSHVSWRIAEPTDAPELSRWCRAVGVPVVTNATEPSEPPELEEFVTLSWNSHLAEGRLPDLIAALKAGEFTSGR